jgi:uncharacterized protein with HEPN domain
MSPAEDRSLRDWLSDIIAWGERIAEHLQGMDESAFAADHKTQDAVIRCLECVGEASRQVVASGHAASFPEVEFLQAYWTRNRLAHGYYDINLARVWLTATESIPTLLNNVRGALRGLK